MNDLKKPLGKRVIIREPSPPDLSMLFAGPGDVEMIGPEEGVLVKDGIVRYTSEGEFKRFRYVRYVEGTPVSVIIVRKQGDDPALLYTAYTAAGHRRKGYGQELVMQARRDFSGLRPHPNQNKAAATAVKKIFALPLP